MNESLPLPLSPFLSRSLSLHPTDRSLHWECATLQQHFQLDAASFRFAYYLWRSQIVRIIHKLKGSLMAPDRRRETADGGGGVVEGGLQLCASARTFRLLSELHQRLQMCSMGSPLVSLPLSLWLSLLCSSCCDANVSRAPCGRLQLSSKLATS